MLAGKGALAIAAFAMLTLAACGNSEPRLMNLRTTGNGPDEFGILPPKALEMPEDIAALPEPTPGGSNLTDPTPEGDAIAALGGREGASSGVPAGDAALVNSASRFGRTADIRNELAVADLQFRRDNKGKILERIFGQTVYFRAYSSQSLNQQAELARWRRAGVRTNTAPPAQPGEK